MNEDGVTVRLWPSLVSELELFRRRLMELHPGERRYVDASLDLLVGFAVGRAIDLTEHRIQYRAARASGTALPVIF